MWDQELFSELAEPLIVPRNFGDRELFLELAEPPIARQTVCDREPFSEVAEPPIVPRTFSDRELFSELAEPPIVPQTMCDRKLFSGLFETLIHPTFLNMVPPHVDVVKLKGETCNEVSLQPHEIGQSHKNVMAHLIRENRELSASLEAKAVDLYLHMCQNLSHCWQ